MKKLKILIIFIILIILILIGVLLVMNLSEKDDVTNSLNSINNQNISNNIKNTSVENITNNTINNNVVSTPDIELVKSKDDFFTIKSCVEKYINYIISGDSKAIYKLLDFTYIKQKNITENNVFENIERINKPQIFTANKMEFAKVENIEIYVVDGYIREDKLNERADDKVFNVTVILNKEDNIFSIIPGKLNIKTSYSLVGKNTENLYNEYNNVRVEDQTMANIYFTDYKSKMLNNLQEGYNLLDKEYKEKRFKNFSTYQEYINYREEKLNKINLNRYSINKYDNYTLYTCIDQYNNYYIFKETAVMQYTVMLDEYTIDSEAYINEYQNLSMQKKMEKNINKFIRMINNKDYESAYNVLNNDFKNNYFKTLREFQNYINNNFYNYCDVTFKEFSQEGDIGIYKVNINGVVDDKDVSFAKTIIMKLGEGTSFEMSFDI